MKTFPKSTEQIQDIVAALLVEGTGVTLAYNDGAGTLTISSSVDLTGYATTAYVDDEVSANGTSLQAFASNASNLSTGQVSDNRLSANVARRDQANTFSAAVTAGSSINMSSGDNGIIVSGNLRLWSTTGSSLIWRNSTNTGNLFSVDGSGNTTVNGWIDGKHRPYTFAGLPLASAAQDKTFVCTDSTLAMTSANYGSTPAGGGANRVRVFSNGTAWLLA